MPDWLCFVMAAFACFRLAEFAAVDDGPGDMLLMIRAKLGAYDLGEDGRIGNQHRAHGHLPILLGRLFCGGSGIASLSRQLVDAALLARHCRRASIATTHRR